MPVPAPPVELHDHCSAIFNNTLYIYSPEAFQSLPLEANTQWKVESMGISVTGATCVVAYPGGDPNQASFYVVGGSTNSSEAIYPGLQAYSFQDKKWQTITPESPVTRNRQHHGAAYLNTSSSILVYGGSQNGDSDPSTQTFLISTQPPYSVLSYMSVAPPVVDPLVLPWNDNAAVVIGGDPNNMKVFTFGPLGGWQDAGVNLINGLKDRKQIQAVIVHGDDDSTILGTFDMSTSPNTVTDIVLLDPGAVPAPAGQTVGNSTQSSARLRERNTVADWPQYNNTLAPTTTRNGFSLAQSPSNGFVVITGGNAQDPLQMFDEDGNGWLNATSFLNIKATTTTQSRSSTPTSSTSPSSSASSSAAPTVGGSSNNSRSHTLKILGVTLGAIFGLMAILILILLLLRWHRRRRDAGHKRKTSDFPSDKDNRLSFQDRGMDRAMDVQPLGGAGEPMGRIPRATDSMAIMSGRDVPGSNPTPTKRTDVFLPSMRFSRTPSPFGKGIHLGEEVHMRDITKPPELKRPPPVRPPRVDNRLTDEGWSRYFQGNKASNLAHMNSGRSTYASQDSISDYRNSAYPHGSAEVAPLNLGRFSDGRQLNHVPIGSPSTEHAVSNGRGTGFAVSEGLVGKISHADSASLESEEDDRNDAFSSGIPASIQDGDHLYTIPEPGQGKPRPPSSTYTLGSYYPNTRDTRIQAPSQAANFEFPLPSDHRVTRWPTNDHGESFPFPAPQAPPEPQTSEDDYFGPRPTGRQTGNSDMSWLNLGGSAR